jgi:hypothetical protein
MRWPSVIIGMFLLAVILLIGFWDVWVGAAYGEPWTVSYQLSAWARRWPVLPLLIGILIGHLFACPECPPR